MASTKKYAFVTSDDEAEDNAAAASPPPTRSTTARRQQAAGNGRISKRRSPRASKAPSTPESSASSKPLPTPDTTPATPEIDAVEDRPTAEPQVAPVPYPIKPNHGKPLTPTSLDHDSIKNPSGISSDDESMLDSPVPAQASLPNPKRKSKTQQNQESPTPAPKHSRPTGPRTSKSSPASTGGTASRPTNGCPPRKSRTASSPAVVTTAESRVSPNDIDDRIEECITKRCSTLGVKEGFVYAEPAWHKGKALVKVGFTQNLPADRMQRIQSDCKCINFDPPELDRLPKFLYCKQVERLAHAELSNFQYHFECTCPKKVQHREFFDIDEHTAHSVVERWMAFSKKLPWEAKGDKLLKEHWDYRLRYHRARCDSTEDYKDHKTRHRRWERFVDVRHWDMAIYYLFKVASFFFSYPWQAVCIVQGILIAWLVPSGVTQLAALTWLSAAAIFFRLGYDGVPEKIAHHMAADFMMLQRKLSRTSTSKLGGSGTANSDMQGKPERPGGVGAIPVDVPENSDSNISGKASEETHDVDMEEPESKTQQERSGHEESDSNNLDAEDNGSEIEVSLLPT